MKSKPRFAVIGIGRFGSAIASKLAIKEAEVIAIDISKDRIDSIKESVTYSVVLDSTDKNALLSQNINEMDAVVVAIGEDFQALLLTTFTLQEINVKRIIVRAQDEAQKKILNKMGIDEILSPEEAVSDTVSETLINPSVLLTIPLPDSYEIIEVKAPRGAVNRTLHDISLRQKYKLNLVTLLRKRGEHHHILGVPEATTVIEEDDLILIFGKTKDIDRFIDINE
ncbi:MAG: TrkA family potassium uptake protein [Flavobacteriales bacterium]|nr:TrkA family potassium uptake protein [Flavobacteriales bacterium]